MPSYDEGTVVSQAAAAELRATALSEAKEILGAQQVTLSMKKASAQKLYQLAIQLAERELTKEEDSANAD